MILAGRLRVQVPPPLPFPERKPTQGRLCGLILFVELPVPRPLPLGQVRPPSLPPDVQKPRRLVGGVFLPHGGGSGRAARRGGGPDRFGRRPLLVPSARSPVSPPAWAGAGGSYRSRSRPPPRSICSRARAFSAACRNSRSLRSCWVA